MKPLTKQQVFDLQLKWNIKASPSIMKKKNWWNHKEYWDWISENCELPNDFIDEFNEYLDFYELSNNESISEEVFRKFKDKKDIDWFSIKVRFPPFSNNFINDMIKEHYIEPTLDDSQYDDLGGKYFSITDDFVKQYHTSDFYNKFYDIRFWRDMHEFITEMSVDYFDQDIINQFKKQYKKQLDYISDQKNHDRFYYTDDDAFLAVFCW